MGASDLVNADDRFHVGSMAKAMTATVIATLVEERLLAWTTRPIDVWPELAQSIRPAFRDVTLAQLLAHRAGLPAFEEADEFVAFPAEGGNATALRAEFATWVLSRDEANTPGVFRYSNAGYVVAAAMAEAVSEQSWEALMRDRLFQPLGMETPVFAFPDADRADAPSGHVPSATGFVAVPPPGAEFDALLAVIVPAGHLSMSVADYARFLRLHLQGLRGVSGLLLAPETFRVLHAPVGSPVPGLGEYALGWVIVTIDGTRASVHDGSLTGFYAVMALVPDLDVAGVVATNADPSGARVVEVVQDALITMISSGERIQ
jgi:CubicO group peptidase (beta-lactamase class C family)